MNNFVEINEVGSYDTGGYDSEGYAIWKHYIKGSILINTEHIRCVSISGYKFKDKANHIVDEDSLTYTVYFDKDRYVTIDIESYNKIKDTVLKKDKDKDIICE